ncbi:uncharacterized protein LOC117179974 [Belonocnema kinseyi]|uniref:uncharacterized protein LOC117179974 n=1 Tax=Belonocnema kinseyi TaxID=2817044 RepID=UPI00143D0DB4|nr:uncharacterized protein LOC117179974 [Belonocnema kinseyi]
MCKDRGGKKQKGAAHTRICKEFKERTGLIIDQPRHGTGNSNSGNTARRFFADPDRAAEITGVNKELIVGFSQIWQMLTSSSTKVPPMFFNKFAFETAQLYVSLYPWYFMPPSVQKMLLHGATVMQHFLLLIGQYSEEAT